MCLSGSLHANPISPSHFYVLRIKSLSEICRRLPSAEAMLLLLLLGWGWRREEGELAPACAAARPNKWRLLLLPAPRQPASIIMDDPCEVQ